MARYLARDGGRIIVAAVRKPLVVLANFLAWSAIFSTSACSQRAGSPANDSDSARVTGNGGQVGGPSPDALAAIDAAFVVGGDSAGGIDGTDAVSTAGAGGLPNVDAPGGLGGSLDTGSSPVDASVAGGGIFPAMPILDPNSPGPVPANPESQFVGSPSGSGPCVTEPEDGALYPNNWTRPRIKWSGTSGLVQITVHTEAIPNDLVVYTTGNSWTMDTSIWKALAQKVREQDISVAVRGTTGGVTTVAFKIASVGAPGRVIILATDPAAVGNQNVTTVPDTSAYLLGLTVGDDSALPVLKFSQALQPSRDQSAAVRTPTCIGCHSVTPDSEFVSFVDNWPFNLVIAGVGADNTGAQLTNLTKGGLADLNKPWAGPATFSTSAWVTGQRVMVTTSAEQNEQAPWSTDNKQPAKLVWYNLDSPTPPILPTVGASQQPIAQMSAGNYGVVARNGDTNCAAFPTWSHNGNIIIYASSNGGCQNGMLQQGATDLFAVPFNGGNGGDVIPVPGASEKAWEEYYPAIAPDDSMLVFDRIASGGVMYANDAAEMYFVPLGSVPAPGTALRLTANDPVLCTGMTSPGMNNHLPKWAPAVQEADGQSYYWIIYSSNRAGIPCVTSPYDGKCHKISQLYLTAITLKDGKYSTYPSIYLWNQPTKTVNMPDWAP